MTLPRAAWVAGFAVALASCGGARDDALEATLFVTAKPEALFAAWQKPTGQAFSIEPVEIAERGEFLAAVVLFRNCAPDGDGNCNVAIDITAFDPGGKVYGALEDGELWKGKPAPPAGRTQLGVHYMGLAIEPLDPAGTYRVVATARDLVAGTEATSEARFDVK